MAWTNGRLCKFTEPVERQAWGTVARRSVLDYFLLTLSPRQAIQRSRNMAGPQYDYTEGGNGGSDKVSLPYDPYQDPEEKSTLRKRYSILQNDGERLFCQLVLSIGVSCVLLQWTLRILKTFNYPLSQTK